MERAVLAGGGYRDIAGRHGVSKSALERHHKQHLPARLAKAAERREIADGRSLLDQLQELGEDTRAILDEARGAADGAPIALKAIARLERQLELQGRLLGELKEAPAVNVLIAPEWVGLRTAVLGALAPFPEARRAVAEAIRDR